MGNAVLSLPEAAAPIERGAQPVKGADEIFCPSCGAIIKQAAILCVKCGVPPSSSGAIRPKRKTTALLLALFLGICTWLYTYRRDAWKFWVAFLMGGFLTGAADVGLSFLFGFGCWIWAAIDVLVRPGEFYTHYPHP
ncbi:MAG: hypothetical protein HYR55_11745 [Acidobacteria bacterium]|nr:hypothetical protein [Acidobacteriota bacterium]MBI3657262.1 hypothetical protein [Acidobacteriota bacterium]